MRKFIIAALFSIGLTTQANAAGVERYCQVFAETLLDFADQPFRDNVASRDVKQAVVPNVNCCLDVA